LFLFFFSFLFSFFILDHNRTQSRVPAEDPNFRKTLSSLENENRWPEALATMEEDTSEFFESLALFHVRHLVAIARTADGQPDSYGNTRVTGRLTMTKSALDTRDYLVTIVSVISRLATSQNGITYYVTDSENVMQRDPEEPFVLTYSNVSNLVVTVAAKDPNVTSPAVLISTHYDSVVFSPGASDNGGTVGVALELLRVLTHREPYDFPIIFLFDDAEEAGGFFFLSLFLRCFYFFIFLFLFFFCVCVCVQFSHHGFLG